MCVSNLVWYSRQVVHGDLLAPSFPPGWISQGRGAVRGVRGVWGYPKQSYHTTAQQVQHHSVLQVPVPSAYLGS